MLEDVPQALKNYPQWIVWQYQQRDGAQTKVPFSAVTGQPCSVKDQLAWATFERAVAYYQQFHAQLGGVGFCFSEGDPFTGIDLDDPFDAKHKLSAEEGRVIQAAHERIATIFDSYTEMSPSGTGRHILICGKIASGIGGLRHRCVEIYSRERFFTVTGQICGAQREIHERQDFLNTLVGEIDAQRNVYIVQHDSAPQLEDDRTIYDRAVKARDGQLFLSLWNGDFAGPRTPEGGQRFPSQSEADFALVNILGFYSSNHEQITRLFRMSALGQRDKAKRGDYVSKMVKRSQDRKLPEVDISALTARVEAMRNPVPVYPESVEAKPIEVDDATTWITKPPGLVGELMDYVTAVSVRTTPEMALCAALGFMAGVCGHAYNVNGTGLNFYAVIVAATGRGKESYINGINRIVAALSDITVQPNHPAVKHYIGPADFASGQGLARTLEKQSTFVSTIGEIGFMLENFANPKYVGPDTLKRRMLLLLYNRSGQHDTLPNTAYADKVNDIKLVRAPAVTIIGETTPETFNRILTRELISDGMLTRFSLFEYHGLRGAPNWNAAQYRMPDWLRAKLCDWLMFVSRFNMSFVNDEKDSLKVMPSVIHVGFDEAAWIAQTEFDAHTTDMINKSDSAIAELWNRAHLKSLKFAALVAMGIDWLNPTITLPCYEWAKALVMHEVSSMLRKFETGVVGNKSAPATIEVRQAVDVAKVIKKYFMKDEKSAHAMKGEYKFWESGLVPLRYIRQYAVCYASFQNDRSMLDVSKKLDRALGWIVSNDALVCVEPSSFTFQQKFGDRHRNNFYGLTSMEALDTFITSHGG